MKWDRQLFFSEGRRDANFDRPYELIPSAGFELASMGPMGTKSCLL
jgi:hypothetical protein